MRFSLTTGAVGDLDPIRMAELAVVAERAGWDAFFLEDYLVYQGLEELPTWDPWTCLTAMAAATSTLRLGTTVTPLPRRKPWDVAAQAVALDRFSGGRLVLGVGAGDSGDPGFSRVGDPTTPRLRAERLDESLTVIAGLLTGEPVHHRGRHYRIDGLRLAALPVQRPRFPVWIGGDMMVPGVRRRIARWDGSCAYKGSTDVEHPAITSDDVSDLLDEVSTIRGSIDGFDVKVGGDPAEWQALAAAGATWFGQWVSPLDPRGRGTHSGRRSTSVRPAPGDAPRIRAGPVLPHERSDVTPVARPPRTLPAQGRHRPRWRPRGLRRSRARWTDHLPLHPSEGRT